MEPPIRERSKIAKFAITSPALLAATQEKFQLEVSPFYDNASFLYFNSIAMSGLPGFSILYNKRKISPEATTHLDKL